MDAILEDAEVDAGVEVKLSPLEQVLVQEWDAVARTPTQSDRRAVVLAENMRKWAMQDQIPDLGGALPPSGEVTLTTDDGKVKTYIEGELGEELAWVEVYRAMEAAADLSNGRLVYENPHNLRVVFKCPTRSGVC